MTEDQQKEKSLHQKVLDAMFEELAQHDEFDLKTLEKLTALARRGELKKHDQVLEILRAPEEKKP